METILKVEMPFKRHPSKPENRKFMPLRERLCGWLISWGGGSIQEFGGSRINRTHNFLIFRWHVLTIHRNEYHDRSDKERADEYLRKWSACEKELRGYRLMALGDSTGAEIKKLIRESFGVDLDEGRIL